MAIAEVTPGVCGLKSHITATLDEESGVVTLAVDSDCEAVKRLAEVLPSVDGQLAALTPLVKNPIFLAAAAAQCHPACVVPTAILRAVEVASELALPRDVTIHLTK